MPTCSSAVIGEIAEAQRNNVEVDLRSVGAKAVAFFRRMGGNVVGTATHLGDKPSVNDLIGSIKIMLDPTAKEKSTGCSWCTTSSLTR